MITFSRKQNKRIHYLLKTKTIAEVAREIHCREDDLITFLSQNRNYFQDVVTFEEESEESSYPAFFIKCKKILLHPVSIALLFSILIISIYYSSLGNVFISDDIPGIVKNRSFYSLKSTISNTQPIVLRPLLYFSLIKLVGMNAAVLRFSNILLHITTSFLVFLYLKKLFKNTLLGLIGGILFAVHPVQTESVVWITGGTHVQYTLFTVLSLYAYSVYTQSNKKIFLLLTYFASFLAFTTSEKAVVVPVLLFLYILSFGMIRKRWKSLILYIPILVISLSFAYIQIQTRIAEFTTIIFTNSGLINPLTIPAAISTYIQLLFIPVGLSFYKSGWTLTGFNGLLYMLIIVGFVFAFFYSWKHNRVMFFCLGFFIISLSPMLLPLNIYAWGAERYVYLASIGIIALQVILLDKITSLVPNSRMMLLITFLFTVPFIFGILSFQRTKDWKTENAFAQAAARVGGDSELTHNNLGLQHYKNGKYQEAIDEFNKTLLINPQFAEAYLNMANAYKQLGQVDQAVSTYQKALTNFPNCWQCYTNLGIISYEKKDLVNGIQWFEKAVAINSQEPQILNNLAVLYLEAGDMQKAKEILIKSLAIEPNDQNVKKLYDEITK